MEDITPTYLTNGVLSTLRQADYLATEVLHATNTTSSLSQMPVIIIPVHFDRDPVKNSPSCQRSIVIRTFITNDFMTGIAATPNKQFPAQVWLISIKWTLCIYDLGNLSPLLSPWETCCRGNMASPSVCMWLWNWKITSVPSIVQLLLANFFSIEISQML